MNDIHRNEAELEGLVRTPPAYSHENHGKPFYHCLLEIPRLSGQVDLLPLLLPEELHAAAVPGKRLRVHGQFRSFNNRSGQGSRLVLSTHVLALVPPTGENCNRIPLQGALCKDPPSRRTPLGRSRTYLKRTDSGTEERTAYEVSVMHLAPGDPAWEEG